MRSPYFIMMALLVAAPALAAEGLKPLWELGMGAGFINMPDYPGSDEQRNYFYPLPYIRYRGETFKVDRDGIRNEFLRTDRLKLDISLNIGVPVRSKDNEARRGMPDLKTTLEFGPSLEVFLHGRPADKRVWSLRFPVRVAVATDLKKTEPVGWVFEPHINYDTRDTGPGGGWTAGFRIGPRYGTERYNDYYYQVDPEFATGRRPAYDAREGYAGLRFGASARKVFGNYWVLMFLRYDYLGGAVFEGSPLVRQRHAVLIGGGVSYIFARSDKLVQAAD